MRRANCRVPKLTALTAQKRAGLPDLRLFEFFEDFLLLEQRTSGTEVGSAVVADDVGYTHGIRRSPGQQARLNQLGYGCGAVAEAFLELLAESIQLLAIFARAE